MVASGRRVLMHGGYGHGDMQGNLDDLWAFDGQWRRCSPTGPLPAARAGHTLSVLEGGDCVMYGGFGHAALDDVHILTEEAVGGQLSPGSLAWTQPRVLGPSPGARCAHSAVPTRRGGVLGFACGGAVALSSTPIAWPRSPPTARLMRRTISSKRAE